MVKCKIRNAAFSAMYAGFIYCSSIKTSGGRVRVSCEIINAALYAEGQHTGQHVYNANCQVVDLVTQYGHNISIDH